MRLAWPIIGTIVQWLAHLNLHGLWPMSLGDPCLLPLKKVSASSPRSSPMIIRRVGDCVVVVDHPSLRPVVLPPDRSYSLDHCGHKHKG